MAQMRYRFTLLFRRDKLTWQVESAKARTWRHDSMPRFLRWSRNSGLGWGSSLPATDDKPPRFLCRLLGFLRGA
jgi:hypothetical protein